MNLHNKIIDAFKSADLLIYNLVVDYYKPENFGNYQVQIDSSIGKLKITSDRGQEYIDTYNKTICVYEPAEKLYPALMQIYAVGSWSLLELLICISKLDEGDGDLTPI